MRAARADDSGKNALIGVIERDAVEDPLSVATLGGIIEQRGEAARHAHRGCVFQVDGVERLVLEAGQRFVCRIQYVSVPNDVLEVGGGSSVDHGVNLDRPLGLVAQLKVKAILTLDPVDSRVAANLAPMRHHVSFDRWEARERSARGPIRWQRWARRIAQHVARFEQRPGSRGVSAASQRRTARMTAASACIEQPLGRTAIAADTPV